MTNIYFPQFETRPSAGLNREELAKPLLPNAAMVGIRVKQVHT